MTHTLTPIHTPAVTQEEPFKPHPMHRLFFVGILLCMGVIMLGMVITSPARKRKMIHE